MKSHLRTIGLISMTWALQAVGGDGAVDGLFRKGDALDRRGQTQAALDFFLSAEKANEENADLYWRIAREYCLLMPDAGSTAEKKALGEKAVAAAKRAEALAPTNANAVLALAVSYGRLARQEDNRTKLNYSRFVKTYADKAVALAPEDDMAHYVLGAWHYEIASLGTVQRALAKLIYGSVPVANYDDAAAQFREAIRLNPKRMGHHVGLGRTLAEQGKKEEARKELTTALAMPDVEKDDPVARSRAAEALKSL